MMAWNFGTNDGCVSFNPITAAALQEFNGLTVDFQGTGVICSIYHSTDPFTAPRPTPQIVVSAAGITYEHFHWGGGGGTTQSEWTVAISSGWHHLNLYTDSIGRLPVVVLDGVDLGFGTIISNPVGFGSNQGGPWVIGGSRLGAAYTPGFSGRMAHFSYWGASSAVSFNGTAAMRAAIQASRWSPLYFRDFIASSNGDPGQVVYVPMADAPNEEICRVTGVTLTKVGTVTREDDPQGWWVIGRMDPYTDWAVAVPPIEPPEPPVPTPLATKIVAEFIL